MNREFNDHQSVILLSPANIYRITNFLKKNPQTNISWIYLGSNYFLTRKCRELLDGKAKEINFFNDLEDIAENSEEEYTALIDSLNYENIDNLLWWFTPISTRCPLISNVHLHISLFRLVEKYYYDNTLPNLIIIESEELFFDIESFFSLNNVKFFSDFEQYNIPGKNRDSTRYKQSHRPLKIVSEILHNSILFLIQLYKFSNRLIRRRIATYKTHKNMTRNFGKNITLIVTFFFNESLKNRKYHDKYFLGLFDFFRKNEVLPVIIPRFVTDNASISLFKKIRKSEEIFQILDDYLTLGDYLSAAILSYKERRKIIQNFRIKDTRIPFQTYIHKEIENSNYFTYISCYLTYIATKRLCLQLSGIQSVILWYENQYEDRAIIRAVKEVNPETKIIGFEGFIHYSHFLSYSPVQSEIDAGVAPDLILITGSSQERFINKFTKNIPHEISGALRYDYIYSISKEEIKQSVFNPRECIFVILPGTNQTNEMIDVILEFILDNRFLLPIYIKDHPNCPRDCMNKIKFNKNILKYDGSLKEIITYNPIVITGTSSTVIESLSMGIPTIFLGQKNVINFDPLLDRIPYYFRGYNTSELIKIITSIIEDNPIKQIDIFQYIEKIRTDFFQQVNSNSLKPFLTVRDKGDKERLND